jgi:hypothetical protein
MKLIIATLILMLTLSTLSPAAAQDEALEPCERADLHDLNTSIESAALDLSYYLENEDEDIGEAIDDITIIQRVFYDAIFLMPDCAEKYTRGYRMMVLLDQYSIAYGLRAAAQLERENGNRQQAGRLEDQADKHVREAERIVRTQITELDVWLPEGR